MKLDINISNLTKLIASFLNKDSFQDAKLAGKVLIGINDTNRLVRGSIYKVQDLELFQERLLQYISKNTLPDIHGHVKIHFCEVIHYDDVSRSFMPLQIGSSRPYILEIEVLRIEKDPLIAIPGS